MTDAATAELTLHLTPGEGVFLRTLLGRAASRDTPRFPTFERLRALLERKGCLYRPRTLGGQVNVDGGHW